LLTKSLKLLATHSAFGDLFANRLRLPFLDPQLRQLAVLFAQVDFGRRSPRVPKLALDVLTRAPAYFASVAAPDRLSLFCIFAGMPAAVAVARQTNRKRELVHGRPAP
jgi:hypothetical protein